MNCPHCGKEIRTTSPSRHIRSCPERDGMFERLREVLEDPAFPGCIRTQRQYDIVRMPGMPPATTLAHHCGGMWMHVAERFGLEQSAGIYQHDNLVKKAATKAALLELAKLLHNGNASPTRREYDINRPPGALETERLIRKYGTWEEVCIAYNVLPPAVKVAKQRIDDSDNIRYGAPYWFNWQVVDGNVIVTQTNVPTFHG